MKIFEEVNLENLHSSTQAGGHLLYMKMEEASFCFYREDHSLGFTKEDSEYLKTFFSEIGLIRKNLHAILFQTKPDRLQGLVDIQKNLKKISYIKKNNNYAVVFSEQILQKEFDVRLSLPTLEMYFEEGTFQRVHRSYLVNPKNVLGVINDQKGNKKIRFKNPDLKSLSIGPSYLHLLQKKYPNWFK